MLCISVFVDAVMFTHNGLSYGVQCVHVYIIITRQRFHVDIRSLWNTNRKSHLVSRSVPSSFWSDDCKCPKSCFGTF